MTKAPRAYCHSCGRPWVKPGDPDPEHARIEALEEALSTILANTEADAIPHIAYNGLTAYQALAKDIADCARAALNPRPTVPRSPAG